MGSIWTNWWNDLGDKLRKVINNWQNRKEKKNEKTGSRTGCEWSPIDRCYPTTVWRGSFCLLCFHPGPVRFSLTSLENSDFSVFTILTSDLARTLDLHRTITPRNPALKPFNDPSLQVTGLQACATTTGWWNMNKFNRSIVKSLDCLPEVKSLHCIIFTLQSTGTSTKVLVVRSLSPTAEDGEDHNLAASDDSGEKEVFWAATRLSSLPK